MATKIDVLAELDRRLEIGALFGQEHDIPAANLTGDAKLREARDAIAQLISDVRTALEIMESEGNGDSPLAAFLRGSLRRMEAN